MPAYAIYAVESFTGTTFANDDLDIPERLTLVGVLEAVNGDDALAKSEDEVQGRPTMVLRLNTIEHHALRAGTRRSERE